MGEWGSGVSPSLPLWVRTRDVGSGLLSGRWPPARSLPFWTAEVAFQPQLVFGRKELGPHRCGHGQTRGADGEQPTVCPGACRWGEVSRGQLCLVSAPAWAAHPLPEGCVQVVMLLVMKGGGTPKLWAT